MARKYYAWNGTPESVHGFTSMDALREWTRVNEGVRIPAETAYELTGIAGSSVLMMLDGDDYETLPRSIGETVTAICKHYGITQTELAKRIGVAPSSLTHIMKGDREMRVRTAKRFGEEFGFDWWNLYEFPDDKEKS